MSLYRLGTEGKGTERHLVTMEVRVGDLVEKQPISQCARRPATVEIEIKVLNGATYLVLNLISCERCRKIFRGGKV